MLKGKIMGVYSKAILAFLALVVTNLIAVVVDPTTSALLPQTAGEWWSAILTTLVGTFVVWWKANAPAPISK